MNQDNRFSPPRTQVADRDAPYDGSLQEVRVWSAKGRIGRLRYLGFSFMAYLAFIVAMMVVAMVGGAAGPDGAVAGVLMLVLAIPYVVLSFLLLIQRSHDMGWSGWTVLLAFIPLAIFIWMFKPGTPGANRFGPPPPPTPTGVKVAAFGFPVIMVLAGIAAAIALPAYQQYVERTRAAQSMQMPQGQMDAAPAQEGAQQDGGGDAPAPAEPPPAER